MVGKERVKLILKHLAGLIVWPGLTRAGRRYHLWQTRSRGLPRKFPDKIMTFYMAELLRLTQLIGATPTVEQGLPLTTNAIKVWEVAPKIPGLNWS